MEISQNKRSNNGFTLAELLIVVAIIGVLVTISIPIFIIQLRKARLATNKANARSGYAAAMSYNISYLQSDFSTEYDGGLYCVKDGIYYPGYTIGNCYKYSTDISSWTLEKVKTDFAKKILGDETIEVWAFDFNKDDPNTITTITIDRDNRELSALIN